MITPGSSEKTNNPIATGISNSANSLPIEKKPNPVRMPHSWPISRPLAKAPNVGNTVITVTSRSSGEVTPAIGWFIVRVVKAPSWRCGKENTKVAETSGGIQGRGSSAAIAVAGLASGLGTGKLTFRAERPAGRVLAPFVLVFQELNEQGTGDSAMTPQTAVSTVRPARAPQGDRVRADISSQALAHMVDAVNRTRIETNPFPHFIVGEIFPADLYREMVASLPDPRMYRAFSYAKHAPGGVSNRGCFGLTADKTDDLLGRQQSLWLGVRDALGAPQFKQAVFEKLSLGLAYRLGLPPAEAARTPGYPLPELFRETSGYRIKPHPDTRRKLVTMQIALAEDDSQADIGTEFYRRSLNPLAMLREPRGFEIVKRAPFLPNVAYAFVVINTLRLRSWHGRTPLAEGTGVRNTILNIWYARPEDANADLVEQYYQAK